MFSEVDYEATYGTESSKAAIYDLRIYINILGIAINSESYTPEACHLMRQEIYRLQDIISYLEEDIVKYTAWEDEYFYAAKVWEFFMRRGYGEIITSAIIGNMMIETSGGSLKLNPTIYNPDYLYYGLCQWSLKYCPSIAGASFEYQLEYLDLTIEKEFKVFGKYYKKGFTFEDFLTIDDPAEAALAFAKVYERCGAGSYNKRKQAAIKAYEYFR
jgi:hypothetical protein